MSYVCKGGICRIQKKSDRGYDKTDASDPIEKSYEKARKEIKPKKVHFENEGGKKRDRDSYDWSYIFSEKESPKKRIKVVQDNDAYDWNVVFDKGELPTINKTKRAISPKKKSELTGKRTPALSSKKGTSLKKTIKTTTSSGQRRFKASKFACADTRKPSMTVLKEIAKQEGIKGYSKMKRDEICQVIKVTKKEWDFLTSV
jgi:hypothetical protein